MFGLLSRSRHQIFIIAASSMLATFLLACTPEQTTTTAVEVNDKGVEKKQPVVTKQSVTKKQADEKPVLEATPKTKDFLPEKPIFGKKLVNFNGEKFEYQGGLIQKGTKLFNINMASSGAVKGSFVVVTKTGRVLDTSPIKLLSQQEIAKDTYRLIPTKGKNLESVYRLLQANARLLRVELEIDYSAESGAAKF